MAPAAERFWAKVEKTDGCWLWTAARQPSGYGRFGVSLGRTVFAHRLAYEMAHGAIPDGLELDHLCRNRGCVRPDHLEPVTHRENLLRGDGIPGRRARQTHCIHGHPFDAANTAIRRGCRECRACNTERVSRAYWKRKKGAA